MENRQKQQIMFSLHKTTIDHVNFVPTKFDLPQVEKESNISTREKKTKPAKPPLLELYFVSARHKLGLSEIQMI